MTGDCHARFNERRGVKSPSATHHTIVHQGHWKIQWGSDGIPEFIPPPWVDPEQKPRRNNTHHVTDLLK